MYNTNLAYEEKHAEETKTVWFMNCKTAKLIATIPFAAGCNEPERTATAHLCIYMAEIIDYGMNLLGLIMIEGYHKSGNEDQKHGVYNSFVSGAWNYERMKGILKEKGIYEFFENFDGIDGEWS